MRKREEIVELHRTKMKRRKKMKRMFDEEIRRMERGGGEGERGRERKGERVVRTAFCASPL